MGSGTWDPGTWKAYSSSTVGKSTSAIYKSREIHPDLDPQGVAMRESRDSTDNPNSTPIIVGLDVTGSMGILADTLAREGLGVLFSEILARKPVTDPHMMFMAIGDAYCDRAPLQVSQFEADARIIEQLTNIFLEGGGGGNNFESYNLPWYFAAQHTSVDSIEKRKKKGYLFTVGDECAPGPLTVDQIKRIIGDDITQDLPSKDILRMAEKMYHVFHVIVEEGSYARSQPDRVLSTWKELLGQRVLRLSDHTKLSEVIVSAIQVIEGEDKAAVVDSWSGKTSIVVKKAIDGLTTTGGKAKTAVTRF
jgi:hypothetical protein